jgi:hypothetical protein
MQLLVGNLQKITEHGKRADGIVKSMLSHSRGGSGDWTPSDINVLVEEALNLAYHGARAQDKEFNVTLERDFETASKLIDVVPQDVTRVFLNLFGNGFYAANKRALPPGRRAFDRPSRSRRATLARRWRSGCATTASAYLLTCGKSCSSPSSPPSRRARAPGLGLSISYDIVTQQHGGTIEVESDRAISPNSPCACPQPARPNQRESVMSVSILVVDDEADVAELFRQQFRREVRQGQYVMHFAQSAEQALDMLEGGIPAGADRHPERHQHAWHGRTRPVAPDQGAACRPARDHGDGLWRRRTAPQGGRVRRQGVRHQARGDFSLLKQQLQQLSAPA